MHLARASKAGQDSLWRAGFLDILGGVGHALQDPGKGCPERSRLAAEVDEVLGRIVDLIRQQRQVVSSDRSKFHALDRELELAIGEKERCIGALRQHEKEHGCP